MNPLFTHVFKLGCDDVDDVVWYGLWYEEVNHKGTSRHRVRRVDTGELEVVDAFWGVVGRDRTERKGASGGRGVERDGVCISSHCPVPLVVRLLGRYVGRSFWR